MANIHPSAIVSTKAEVGDGVSIGPYCAVGDGVVLEKGVELISHVVVEGFTRIGANTHVFPFSSIGHRPFDRMRIRRFDAENGEPRPQADPPDLATSREGSRPEPFLQHRPAKPT